MEVKLTQSTNRPNLKSDMRIVDWQLGRLSPMPSHVPNEWELVHLTSVAKLESGHTPSRRHPEYWAGDIPWISLHDSAALDVPEIYYTAQTISKLGLENSSARLLPKGTVVFSRTATVGKSTVMGREMATSQDFANYICSERLHNHYLMHLFRFMAPEWKRLMAGSTHNSIYMPVFQDLQILLPPIAEERAIAEVLSDVDTLIAALDRLIAKKRTIKQGTMQQLLTGKIRLPGFAGAWEVKKLGEVADISKGQLITGQNAVSGSIPVIAGGKQPAYYHHRPNRFGKTITISASGANAGYVSFYDAPIYASDCSTIDEDEDYEIEFILYQLQLNQEKIYTMQTGGAQPHIHPKDLHPLELCFAEREEQRAIAAVLSDMDAEIAALEARRAKTRALKQGMMQELLTGKTRLV